MGERLVFNCIKGGKRIATIKWDDASDALNWFDSLPRYEGVLGVDPDGYYIDALE
jgi:hypothetical protein